MDDLFEVISGEEFRQAEGDKDETEQPKKRRARKVVTEPRTLTIWYDTVKLQSMGFCTVPDHDEVQMTLDPEKKAYRQKYPTRMVLDIDGVKVCRDCFIAEADKDAS